MVKLVYTYALGAYAARCAGSSPVPGTKWSEQTKKLAFFVSSERECPNFCGAKKRRAKLIFYVLPPHYVL